MSLYWINREGVRLRIMPRPRGNDWLPDDLRVLRQAGVDVIVSALTAPVAEELGLVAELGVRSERFALHLIRNRRSLFASVSCRVRRVGGPVGGVLKKLQIRSDFIAERESGVRRLSPLVC